MRIPFLVQFLFVSLFINSSMGEKEEPSFKGKTRDDSRLGRFDQNRTGPGLHRKKRPPGEEQMELLRFLLEASPERLQVMRRTIERVEKMTPEERKSMRARLKRFRENAPATRTKMMKDFQSRQDLLHRYWKTLEPEARARETKHFHQLPLPDRHKYLEKISKKQKTGGGGGGKRPKGKEATTD